MDSYLPHVGYVQFPRGPHDLSAAVCPACFTPRTARLCPSCGLDLAHPAVALLDTASTDAAAALDRRLELIGQIRFESSLAAAPAVQSVPVAMPAAPPPASTLPEPLEAPPVAQPPRRHLGVQVILLIVGVSLLAVGAIFFLVYAFITFGLVWRSVIIAAVTIAAFTGASLLRRRKLAATAEAIAALAVVFVYLDAFAIRANDLFGSSNADGLLYWGGALLVSSVGFAVWHRLSGLRLPSIVAFSSFAPALALLVGGATAGLDDGVRVFAALLALAVGALTHPLALGKRVEAVAALVFALVGLVAATLVAFFVEPDADWAPLVTFGLVAVVAAAHVALARVGVARLFGIVIACLGAVVAASALFAVGSRLGETTFTVTVPVIAAGVIALALEHVARRTRAPWATGAAASAAGVTALAVLIIAGAKLVRAVVLTASGADRWSIRGGTPVEVAPHEPFASLALIAVAVLAGAAWAFGGTLAARRLGLLSAALGILVLSVPLLPQFWLVVLGWLLLAAASVALLIVARRRGWARGIRTALLVAGLLSLVLSYSASWASIDTWWFGSVVAVGVLVAGRHATSLVPVRAVLVGAGAILALVAVGSEAWHTNERFRGGSGAAIDALHAMSFLAIVLLALALLLRRVLSTSETRVLAWLAFPTAIVTAGLSWAQSGGSGELVLPEFATSIVLGALLIAALLGWVLLPRAPFAPERVATSVALAPAGAWLLDSIARQVAAPEVVASLAPVVAALIVAAISLAVPGARWARDAGAAAVGLAAVAVTTVSPTDATWLTLVLAGVVALLLAVSRDGLFSSASPRKHLGWVALGLAFGGLVWALVERDISDLEPYVLPLTGALLLIALGAWRAHRASAAPAFIALAALLVSLVPLGAISGDGTLVRSVVVAGVSAVLLIVGSFVGSSRYLDVAAGAGAAGVLVAGLARPVRLASEGTTGDPALDVWVAASVALLLVGAVGQARRTGAVRSVIAQVVAVVALVAAVVIEFSVLRNAPLGQARTLVIVAVLATLYVAGMLFEKPPFTRVVAWIALGLATFVGIAGAVVGAVDPFEWVTVMIAIALLVAGATLLHRYPDAGSWPWLAPGLLVLLVPSLIATFVDQPIWRLVAIGVVGVAAVLAGALGKLQAPLIIGAVVLLLHAIRTFSPQIVAVYQLTEWWVWAVIGGAIIVFVAVTFERRMRDLTSLGSRISALR